MLTALSIVLMTAVYAGRGDMSRGVGPTVEAQAKTGAAKGVSKWWRLRSKFVIWAMSCSSVPLHVALENLAFARFFDPLQAPMLSVVAASLAFGGNAPRPALTR